MSNLKIYDAVRNPPTTALKEIQAGRLKGKSDINPMWRIKALTEQFGVCGFGWKYELVEKRLQDGAKDEIAAFVDINLYIKMDGEWSAPIPGTGGSSFVANERNGLYTSDECFKMALTDAISVACKALGFAADVYWNKDDTKYSRREVAATQERLDTSPLKPASPTPATAQDAQEILGAELPEDNNLAHLHILRRQKGISEEKHQEFLAKAGVTTSKHLNKVQFRKYIAWLEKQPDAKDEVHYD